MHITDLDTPVLLIDLAITERNIQRMAAFAKELGVSVRPHIKTHKTPEIALKQIAAGAIGITSQKLSEAEAMIDAGVTDVLIPYQIIGEQKLAHLVELKKKASVMTSLDNVDAATMLSETMQRVGMTHDVVIEINTGLNRCGVLPCQPALDFARQISTLPNLRLRGIFTHEGHIYGAKNPDEAQEMGLKVGREMVETAELLRAYRFDVEIVSVGSTPGARSTPTVKGITEMRPGVYVFNDFNQVQLQSCTLEDCALTVLATVVSRPSPDRVIIDAGSKAMSSDMPALGERAFGYVKSHKGMKFLRANEEHGILQRDANADGVNIGERIEIIPNHSCATVNMHDEVVAVRDGNVEAIWKITGRGKMK